MTALVKKIISNLKKIFILLFSRPVWLRDYTYCRKECNSSAPNLIPDVALNKKCCKTPQFVKQQMSTDRLIIKFNRAFI